MKKCCKKRARFRTRDADSTCKKKEVRARCARGARWVYQPMYVRAWIASSAKPSAHRARTARASFFGRKYKQAITFETARAFYITFPIHSHSIHNHAYTFFPPAAYTRLTERGALWNEPKHRLSTRSSARSTSATTEQQGDSGYLGKKPTKRRESSSWTSASGSTPSSGYSSAWPRPRTARRQPGSANSRGRQTSARRNPNETRSTGQGNQIKPRLEAYGRGNRATDRTRHEAKALGRGPFADGRRA